MEISLQNVAREMTRPDAGSDVKAHGTVSADEAVAILRGVDHGLCKLCGGGSPRDGRRSIGPEVDVLAIV